MLLHPLLQVRLLTSVISKVPDVLFTLRNDRPQPENLLLQHLDLQLQLRLILGDSLFVGIKLFTLQFLPPDYLLQPVKLLVKLLNHQLIFSKGIFGLLILSQESLISLLQSLMLLSLSIKLSLCFFVFSPPLPTFTLHHRLKLHTSLLPPTRLLYLNPQGVIQPLNLLNILPRPVLELRQRR